MLKNGTLNKLVARTEGGSRNYCLCPKGEGPLVATGFFSEHVGLYGDPLNTGNTWPLLWDTMHCLVPYVPETLLRNYDLILFKIMNSLLYLIKNQTI